MEYPVAGQNLGAAGEGRFQSGQGFGPEIPGPGDQDLHRRPSLVRRARISGSCSSFPEFGRRPAGGPGRRKKAPQRGGDSRG